MLPALASGGYPLFRAPWGTNVIAMVLDDDTDWDEVGEFSDGQLLRAGAEEISR